MNNSDNFKDKDRVLLQALKKYADDTGTASRELDSLNGSIPMLKAKVSLLTPEEIDLIKSSVPTQELKRIEKILSEVR